MRLEYSNKQNRSNYNSVDFLDHISRIYFIYFILKFNKDKEFHNITIFCISLENDKKKVNMLIISKLGGNNN